MNNPIDAARDVVEGLRRTNRRAQQRAQTQVERNELAQTVAVLVGIPLKVDGINGWRTRRWVTTFQQSFILGEYKAAPLEVTGQVDERTALALIDCRDSGGHASAHFKYREFRTRLGDPSYKPTKVTTGNKVIDLHRDILLIVEDLRDQVSRRNGFDTPFRIRSGYRDDWWNRIVGGARLSTHRRGLAADFDEALGITREMAIKAGATGIGRAWGSKRCTHNDSRNGRFGSVTDWWYGRPGVLSTLIPRTTKDCC